MEISKEDLRLLWYEDEDGNFGGEPDWVGDVGGQHEELAKRARYQVSRFPLELATTYLRLNDDGSSTEIGRGTSSFSEKLVVAVVRSGDYGLADAILIGAESCERCMNALLHKYQDHGDYEDKGYPEDSEEYRGSRTRCAFCDPSMRKSLAAEPVSG